MLSIQRININWICTLAFFLLLSNGQEAFGQRFKLPQSVRKKIENPFKSLKKLWIPALVIPKNVPTTNKIPAKLQGRFILHEPLFNKHSDILNEILSKEKAWGKIARLIDNKGFKKKLPPEKLRAQWNQGLEGKKQVIETITQAAHQNPKQFRQIVKELLIENKLLGKKNLDSYVLLNKREKVVLTGVFPYMANYIQNTESTSTIPTDNFQHIIISESVLKEITLYFNLLIDDLLPPVNVQFDTIAQYKIDSKAIMKEWQPMVRAKIKTIFSKNWSFGYQIKFDYNLRQDISELIFNNKESDSLNTQIIKVDRIYDRLFDICMTLNFFDALRLPKEYILNYRNMLFPKTEFAEQIHKWRIIIIISILALIVIVVINRRFNLTKKLAKLLKIN